MVFEEGEEVLALGVGGDGGAGALEGGEVGEGTVYELQGAAAWALYAARKLGGQVCYFRHGCVYLADIHHWCL